MRIDRFLVCAAMFAMVGANAANAESPPAFTQDKARRIIGDLQKVVTANGIDQQMTVEIGGIKQWITIRGRDRNNPILLFLHGGPGAPEMPTSWTFQNPWEDYFTVVQWDQRGSGKTYNSNDPGKIRPTMSEDRLEQDTQELVQYLRATYHKNKIFVMGHSWGSVLGLRLAAEHPEWLYAYVGMGQMINTVESERIGYNDLLKSAEAAHDTKAVKALTAIAPYPERNGTIPLAKINVERDWSVKYGQLSWNRDSYGYYYHATQLSPDYTDADLDAIDKGSDLSLTGLMKDFVAVDFTKTTDFRCPIILFNGRHDDTVSEKVAADWFAHVHAPVKKLVWFENSAHMMQIEEPGRVLVHLVEDVRPLADLK
ncbi:MAG TPA: alpha/beta hydrolase [Rhizomicrobium sp.]|nr:alpha/beta hydrolase [Rhizomicrobium sp.]